MMHIIKKISLFMFAAWAIGMYAMGTEIISIHGYTAATVNMAQNTDDDCAVEVKIPAKTISYNQFAYTDGDNEFTIDIYLDGDVSNCNIIAFQANLYFDTEYLAYVEDKTSSLVQDAMHTIVNRNGKLAIGMSFKAPLAAPGEILTLTFRSKKAGSPQMLLQDVILNNETISPDRVQVEGITISNDVQSSGQPAYSIVANSTIIGGFFELSVNSGNIPESYNAISTQFNIEYNKDEIQFIEVVGEPSLFPSGVSEIEYDEGLSLGLMSATPVTGEGEIVKLKFKALQEGIHIIKLRDVIINNNIPVENMQHGSVIVQSRLEACKPLLSSGAVSALEGQDAVVVVEVADLLEECRTHSIEFIVHYDNSILSMIEYDISGTLFEGFVDDNAMLQVNEAAPGQIHVASASVSPVFGEGALIKFKFKGMAPGSSDIRYTGISFSDIDYDDVEGGAFVVRSFDEECAPAMTQAPMNIPVNYSFQVDLVSQMIKEECGLISFQFTMQYNPAILTFNGAVKTGAICEGYEIITGPSNGNVTVAGMVSNPNDFEALQGEGVFIGLSFTSTSVDGDAEFNITDFRFNESAVGNVNIGGILVQPLDEACIPNMQLYDVKAIPGKDFYVDLYTSRIFPECDYISYEFSPECSSNMLQFIGVATDNTIAPDFSADGNPIGSNLAKVAGYSSNGNVLEGYGRIIRLIYNSQSSQDVEVQSPEIRLNSSIINLQKPVSSIRFATKKIIWDTYKGAENSHEQVLEKTAGNGWYNSGAFSMNKTGPYEDDFIAIEIKNMDDHFAIGFSEEKFGNHPESMWVSLEIGDNMCTIYYKGEIKNQILINIGDLVVLSRESSLMRVYINQVWQTGFTSLRDKAYFIDAAIYNTGCVLDNIYTTCEKPPVAINTLFLPGDITFTLSGCGLDPAQIYQCGGVSEVLPQIGDSNEGELFINFIANSTHSSKTMKCTINAYNEISNVQAEFQGTFYPFENEYLHIIGDRSLLFKAYGGAPVYEYNISGLTSGGVFDRGLVKHIAFGDFLMADAMVTLKIFDMNNEIVFQGHNAIWGGNSNNGVPVDPNVYSYEISLDNGNDEPVTIQGHIFVK